MKKIIILSLLMAFSLNFMSLAYAQDMPNYSDSDVCTMTSRTKMCCEKDILNMFLEKYFFLNFLQQLRSRCFTEYQGFRVEGDDQRETRVMTAKFVQDSFFQDIGQSWVQMPFHGLAKVLFDQYERSIFGWWSPFCKEGAVYEDLNCQSTCFKGYGLVLDFTRGLLGALHLYPSAIAEKEGNDDLLDHKNLIDVSLYLKTMVNHISNKENISEESAVQLIQEATKGVFWNEYSKYKAFINEHGKSLEVIEELAKNDFKKPAYLLCKEVDGESDCISDNGEQVFELEEISLFIYNEDEDKLKDKVEL